VVQVFTDSSSSPVPTFEIACDIPLRDSPLWLCIAQTMFIEMDDEIYIKL
jgi:hypothetical protein